MILKYINTLIKDYNTYLGNNPRIVLAVIGGHISNSSIISSVSSSPVNDEFDLVGDFLTKSI